MLKRMIVMLTVTLVIVAGLGFVKFQQIQTAIAEGAAFQPPPEAVTTVVAQQEVWPVTLSAIGTMAAVQGVTVSADLPGHRCPFPGWLERLLVQGLRPGLPPGVGFFARPLRQVELLREQREHLPEVVRDVVGGR